MAATDIALPLIERIAWPDFVARAGVSLLVTRTSRKLASAAADINREFVLAMADYPIAQNVIDANQQHYEVPARFFELVLGPQCKYSCCRYDSVNVSLTDAEEQALSLTAERAALENGQDILELGCGWGSLSLWMARHFPLSRITAVSNSRSQRTYVEAKAIEQGLSNLTVVTADMNVFKPTNHFDRVVSVEMFEHMSNWDKLLDRVRSWLKPDGFMFVHVFSHRAVPYRFDRTDKSDWIAQHFFTGGIMPSHTMMAEFRRTFSLDADWRWSGTHYARTARDWLRNYDLNALAIADVLSQAYGQDADLWRRRWRLFFLATEGLFGHAGGAEWGVSHYRLKPK